VMRDQFAQAAPVPADGTESALADGPSMASAA
jgi:hypothetical protein